MRRFGMFSAWILSFYSNNLYRDVARNWRGICFFYLFALLAVTWIPTLGQAHFQIRRFVLDELPKVASEIPPMEFAGGRLTVEGEQPIFLRDPESREVLAIIDTTGKVTSLADREAFLLVTSDKIIQRDPTTGRVQSQDLSAMKGEFKFSGKELQQAAEKWSPLVVPAMFPLAVVFSLLYRLTLTAIGGGIALLMGGVFGARFSYAGGMRLAAVAMTPGILVDTLLGMLPIGTAFSVLWGLLGWIMPIAYLVFAVKSSAGLDDSELYEMAARGLAAAGTTPPGGVAIPPTAGGVPLESAKYFQ